VSTLLNTPPKNLLKAFKEFIVFFVFYLSFGGSIEGGIPTPSNKEMGLCPRSNKGSLEGGLLTPSNYGNRLYGSCVLGEY